MLKLFRYLDMFGSPLKFRFHDEDTHKTTLGATISLFINIIGYSYAIYMLLIWVTGGFVPNIQDEQIQVQNALIKYNYNPLQISVETILQGSNKIGFSHENQTYPYALGTLNNQTQSTFKNYSQSNCGNGQPSTICLKGENDSQSVSISQSSEFEAQSSLVMFIFPCVGGNCSNDTVFRLKCDFYTENFDISSGNIKRLKKTFAFFTTSSQTFIIQVDQIIIFKFIARLQKVVIDDGGFFTSKQVYELISDVQITTGIMTNVSTQKYGIVRALVHLDTTYKEKTISYVSITEVLAQISSIFSLLYFAQQFLKLFSERRLENFMIFEILKIYFPKLQQAYTKQDIFGRVIQIEGMEKNQLRAFLEVFQPMAQKYLNVIHIYKQIHILQTAMKISIPPDQIQELKKEGDNPFNMFFVTNSEESVVSINQDLKSMTLIQTFDFNHLIPVSMSKCHNSSKIKPQQEQSVLDIIE